MTNKATVPNPLKTYFLHNKGRLIDKWMHYFDVYHDHFARFRNKPVTIVEFGVFHGGSLQMWKQYFGSQARIFGVDINPKCHLEEEQIEILIGDQEDEEFLTALAAKVGPIDILIDDGGHRMSQQLVTFATLFPLIKPDGVYVVEDLHTSYWQYYGGGYGLPNTFIEFAKRLIDHLHAWHSQDPARHAVTYYTKNVRAMHVYDSIIVFDKGDVSPPTTHQTGTPSWTSATEAQRQPDPDSTGIIHAKVFAPRGGIFHETHSASAGLTIGKWRRVRIDLPWGIGDATAPIRFDPANCAALIDVAGVALRDSVTNEILWRCDRRGGFRHLRVAGTARRLPHDRLLRIVSYGEDPQVYLPDLGLGKLDEPLTLEAWLRIDTSHSAAAAVRALDDTAATAIVDVLGEDQDLEPTNSARSAAVPEVAAAFRALPDVELTTDAKDENGAERALPLARPATPVLSIYVADGSRGGFAEEQALHVVYKAGRWVHLLIPLEQSLGSDRLRIDPLAEQGLVDIAGIVLRSAVTGQTLWKANADSGLDALEVRGSAVRLPHHRVARLFSYGDDPQLFLPEIRGVELSEPLKLELWLRAENGPAPLESILKTFVTTNAELLRKVEEKRVELNSTREALDRKAEEFARCSADLDREKRASAELNDKLMQHKHELQETRARLHSLEKERMLQESALRTVGDKLADEERLADQLDREVQILRSELAATIYELSEVTAEVADLKREFVAYKEQVEQQPEETALEKVFGPWKTVLGNRAGAARSSRIELKSPVPTFWIEHPTGPTVEGETIAVSGWALSSTARAVEGIRAATSGQIFVGQHAFERKDVAAAHPDNSEAALSGFIVHLNLSIGTHIITLERLVNSRWEAFASLRHEVRASPGEAENT